jgi:hypothetical protein
MLCHGVLCIFLTTLFPSAAVVFYFCQYEKLLRYGKLATSYIAYCVPPNTMKPYFTNCNDMSRRRWMVRQEVGVATPRRKRYGP